MKNPLIRDSLPEYLVGKEDILFGNLEDIYRFHKELVVFRPLTFFFHFAYI